MLQVQVSLVHLLDFLHFSLLNDCQHLFFSEDDLVSLSGPSYMVNAFQYISNRFSGNASIFLQSSDSMVRRGLQLTDFFDPAFNHEDMGLLAAEFVPPALNGIPMSTPEFSFVTSTVSTGSELFDRKNNKMVCPTVDQIRSTLPECLPDKDGPVKLEESHCDQMYNMAYGDIIAYSQKMDYVPVVGSRHRCVVRFICTRFKPPPPT